MLKDNNDYTFVIKCYVRVWILVWCSFWIMSFGMIWTRPVSVKLLALYEKCYVLDH